MLGGTVFGASACKFVKNEASKRLAKKIEPASEPIAIAIAPIFGNPIAQIEQPPLPHFNQVGNPHS